MTARAWLASGALIVPVVVIAYVALAPATIVAADNAELSTLGAIGGRAHPSGYPLYVMWLRLWSWLPIAPAHASAIATAVLAGAAIGVLRAACRAWGASAGAASVAVAIVAAAPIVLRVHTEAEVFAMNGLAVASVLWLAADAGPLRGARRAVALGAIAGLGLCDHLTCALMAPIGVLGVVRGVREAGAGARARAIAIAATLGAFAAALAPYAYLMIADGPASWGRVGGVADVVDFVLRRDYGGAALSAGAGSVPATTSLAALAVTLGRAWLWLPALAGLAAMAVSCVRRGGVGGADDNARASRASWIALAASWLLAGPALVAMFNIEPDGVGLYIVQRFHVLPALVLAIPVAIAIDRARARVRGLPAWLGGAAPAVFVALVAVSWPWLARVHGTVVEDAERDLLTTLPDRAVVIVASEDQCFGLTYLQLARGERTDVAVVCTSLWGAPWYRARIAAQGLPVTRLGAELGEDFLATGRPLLVDRSQPYVLAALPHYPYGVLERVLPRGAALPTLAAVVADNQALFARFTLDARPHASDDFAAAVYDRYAATWAKLARWLDVAGDADDAAHARELAASLTPD